MTEPITPAVQNDAVAPPVNLGLDELKAQMSTFGEQMGQVLKYMEDAPAIRNSGYFSVDGGSADPNVKSLGDFLKAIVRKDHKRITEVYGAKADLSGDAGVTGGYLLPEQYMTTILAVAAESSRIVSRVSRIPVTARSGNWPALDQFTAPTCGVGNTAFAGGLTSAVRAEGAAYTETEPLFEMVKWEVSDAASGYVEASKEMREDYASLEALLTQLISIAVCSKLEYFILRGNGVGQPLGIMNAPCAVASTTHADNTYSWEDVGLMKSHYRNVGGPGEWLIHPGVWPDIFNLEVGTGGGIWAANLAASQTQALMGYEIIDSEHLPQDDNAGDVILADLKAYLLFVKGGMYIDFSEHASFTSGLDTWRFGMRVDGKPWLLDAITLADPQGSFEVSPFVYHND